MKKICLNENWKFWKNGRGFSPFWDYNGEYAIVNLPHDAMILEKPYAESANNVKTGFRDGGNYTYEKNIFIGEDRRGKVTLLKFDGVYRNCQVYVNGYPAKSHAYGYTQFYVPLTDGVKYGQDNQIRVVVHNGAMPNSRWYSGSGIYRSVYMLTGDPVYFEPESLQAETKSIDADAAIIEVRATLINRSIDVQESRVRISVEKKDGTNVCSDMIKLPLKGESSQTVRTSLLIESPDLWSENSPNLYRIKAELETADLYTDSGEVAFGIRLMTLDSKRGLRINGQQVKLRGACIHHDNGLLGAATYKDAEYRRVRLLKEAGFNSIRMAHHPMSEELLEACDDLGVYVMDEAFDMWTRTKSDLDYALDFDKNWQEDIRSMVKKDYNHPSVIMYSIGNEIPEISHDSGIEYLRLLSEEIKKLDTTRYVTTAITAPYLMGDQMMEIFEAVHANHPEDAPKAGAELADADVNEFLGLMSKYTPEMVNHPITSSRMDRICAAVDIPGYNYMTGRYELDMEENPGRVIVGSETYPPEIGRNWNYISTHENVIGDYTWTGFDYLGEAGIGVTGYAFGEGGFTAGFPCQVAYCGDLDITGFRRPQSYFREIVFGLRKDPYIATIDPDHYGKNQFKTDWTSGDQVSTWTYNGREGKKTAVEVYANASEVELFQNGVSLGRKACGADHNYTAVFETIYSPGTLKAVAYQNGNQCGEFELSTAKEAKFVISEEHGENGLHYFSIELRDSEGLLNTDADKEISITKTSHTINGLRTLKTQ